MELTPTPSGSRPNNGRLSGTPKNGKKSPGDLLGSGKSQLPITRFYSPVSSSSDRSSQPYTPISKGPKVKRQARLESPALAKKSKTKAASSQNPQPIVLSSDDSSDDVFSQNPRSTRSPLVPKSRLNLIKRRLYPVTSSPISSGHSSSRLKKERLLKSGPKSGQQRSRVLSDSDSDEVPQKSRYKRPRISSHPHSKDILSLNSSQRRPKILSDTDSEDQVSMENSQKNCKSLRKIPFSPVSQRKADTQQGTAQPKPLQDHQNPNAVTHVKEHLLTGTLSQSVFISSSEDSDFELHNSKQSHSFLSQSFGGRDTMQSSQRGFLSSQTSRYGSTKSADSRLPPKFQIGSEESFVKHGPLDVSTDCGSSGSNASRVTPISRKHNAITSGTCENSSNDSPCGLSAKEGRKGGRDSMLEDNRNKCIDVSLTDDETHGVEGDHPIYLQDTIPPEGCSFRADPDETNDQDMFEACTEPSPPGRFIYNETTIDPGIHFDATVGPDSSTAAGFPDIPSNQPLTHDEGNTTNRFETTLPVSALKGGVIEASDDEDEYFMAEDRMNFLQVTKSNGSSIGTAFSELLEVSHISGSDDSEFSEIVHSDDELSIINASTDLFTKTSDELATHLESLLVKGSDESSHGLTSIMKSVMDASTDFFSDITSFDTGGSTKDPEENHRTSEQVSCRDLSPTEEIVKIALEVADLKKASESHTSVDGSPSRGEEPDCRSELGLASESVDSCTYNQVGSHLEVLAPLGSGHQSEPCSSSSSRFSNPVVVGDARLAIPIGELENGEAGMTGPPLDDEYGKRAVPSPPQPHLLVQPVPRTDFGMNAIADTSQSMNGEDRPTTNGTTTEMKVVCGIQPPPSSLLTVAENLDKTLINHPNRPLLLDTVISECQNFAEHVMNQEPISTFVNRYSSLSRTSKSVLHEFLLPLLEESNRWLKYGQSLSASVDDLVSSGILVYLDKNYDLITKLNLLALSEITDLIIKLGGFPSESVEIMKNFIVAKLNSNSTCDILKNEVKDLIDRKFVKLSENAYFCVGICLELFVLPLNLCDKLYKTVDVARFINGLIRDVSSTRNRVSLLPLKCSKLVANCGHVLGDLSDLCRLKKGVFECRLNDESIFLRINDVCSSIAVLEFSAETDPSVKNSPTFRFRMTNYVHALDEQLRALMYMNTSDVEFGACIYLGVLLKQNVTGSQHKARWCRERMRHLTKLFDSSVFEEFSKILKQPVSPVEFIVRSEFVLSSFKIKKLGLSLDEKAYLTKLLRPVTHKITQIPFLPLNSLFNQYTVLTKKPKSKNMNLIRANIFDHYKSDFPCGVEDSGGLLFNAIYLTFWQSIYLNLDGMFLNKFQSSPLDWGSEDFFLKRKQFIIKLASDMMKRGIPFVFQLLENRLKEFISYRCVVDWNLVSTNISKILVLLETLGLDKFLNIAAYVLGKLEERVLGFPDMVLWNPESKALKFVGLKKPADPLYPYQTLWLEKLRAFDVDAEELQISPVPSANRTLTGYTVGFEQCSQLK